MKILRLRYLLYLLLLWISNLLLHPQLNNLKITTLHVQRELSILNGRRAVPGAPNFVVREFVSS